VTDARYQKLRLTICCDVTALLLGGRVRRLETVVRDSLAQSGITRLFFEEVFIHLSLVLGFPHMIQGMEILAKVAGPGGPNRMRQNRSKALRGAGLRRFRRVYGPHSARVLSFLDGLQPGLSVWILENVYGRVYARSGLSLSEREVLTLIALNHHGQTKQLYSHIRGALRSGVTAQQLAGVLSRLEKVYGMRTGLAKGFLGEIRVRKTASPGRPVGRRRVSPKN
jgi:alkylhydroperoxidase/carboxymuconolactone decarboxylase family protein YurZ